MTLLASKLRFRMQIRKAVQEENSSGGMDRKFVVLQTVWAGLSPISKRGFFIVGDHIRNQQVDERPTHKVLMRRDISIGIDTIGTNTIIKSDNFLFLDKSTAAEEGRIFRIIDASRNQELNEFLEINVREVEKLDDLGLAT